MLSKDAEQKSRRNLGLASYLPKCYKKTLWEGLHVQEHVEVEEDVRQGVIVLCNKVAGGENLVAVPACDVRCEV